jgi:hypothetical protein
MSTNNRDVTLTRAWLAIALLGLPALGIAQVPVDDNGEPYTEYSTARADAAVGDEGIPLLSANELGQLVGPIALYPDDLLAIVLPAATYPLQIVQAARFLDDVEADASLQPDESWDDSVVALLNYPEVIELLNEDLDWTWRLGEAVVAQQADVIAAVEAFRDRAYAAGNLKTDAHQTVSHSDDGFIEIVPVDDEIIYVPYYEPEHVVVYQPRPVYYYYPRPYPVYYYPYPSSYVFDRGFFWGVTTAFTIGWYTDHLHVFHPSYYGHPYYGRYYYDRWWYRRPSINVYNNYYVYGNVRRSNDYYRSGDYWRSREYRRLRTDDRRITRNRYYPGNDSGYQTRSSSAAKEYAATRTGRDYRHKRFATRNDRSSAGPTRDTLRNHGQTGYERTRDSAKPSRESVSSKGHRGTRDKIEFRERTGLATTSPRRVSPDLGHGLTDARRDRTYGGGSHKYESRDKPAKNSVAARTYGSSSAPRAEPRRQQTANLQRFSQSSPPADSRKIQTASVRRFEQRAAPAPAPRAERKQAPRDVKGGERRASRSADRSEGRRDEARSKK